MNPDGIVSTIKKDEFIEGSHPFIEYEAFLLSLNDKMEDYESAYAGLGYLYLYYKYKFERKRNSEVKELVEGKILHLLRELEEKTDYRGSVESAMKYSILSYIAYRYNPSNKEYLDKSIKAMKENNYFFGISDGVHVYYPDYVGMVLGLLSNILKNNEEYKVFYDEITEKLGKLKYNSNDNINIFLINYCFGLVIDNFISNNGAVSYNNELKDKAKSDCEDIQNRATLVLSNNGIDTKLKIPALIFAESPENYYNEILKDLVQPQFYHFMYVGRYNFEELPELNVSLKYIVQFLFTWKLLSWDKLEQVPPELIRIAKDLKRYKNPKVLEKTGYYILLGSFISAMSVIVLFLYYIYLSPQINLWDKAAASVVIGIITAIITKISNKDIGRLE
ncbi:MAG: hypothetical protein ACP5U0_09760 [Caldisphaera sp.]